MSLPTRSAPPSFFAVLPAKRQPKKKATESLDMITAPPPVLEGIAELFTNSQSTNVASARLRVTPPAKAFVVDKPSAKISPSKTTE